MSFPLFTKLASWLPIIFRDCFPLLKAYDVLNHRDEPCSIYQPLRWAFQLFPFSCEFTDAMSMLVR